MTDVLAARVGPAALSEAERPEAGLDLLQLRADLEEQKAFRVQQIAGLEAGPEHEHGSPLEAVAASLKVAAMVALCVIDAALERMDGDDGYGLCQQCGGSIPAERLKVLPMAALCMPCQAAREQ